MTQCTDLSPVDMIGDSQLLEEAYENYWKHGEPVPVDIGIEIINQGFDLEALESEHI